MPAASVEPPAVSLSFANNFWGKDDAGVTPLLGRMQAAKQTSDELKAFYSARASIEDEYSRKLLSLCRKPLGSQESGSLRTSLDTLRGEVESMARQHQNNAAQMKSELEEPLAAFAGGMKERRKIVQNGIEKLLKTKVQQMQQVNKTRDRYEQECLKIKGYLAQGHMVMGQEERKNKAKLEKTQISVATSNTEYENAVKALEDTTARWNREWKAAADKFQDLEEERLDFTKSSLWQFANISSTVCVSDDASCEKIRLSLEKLDVETDIFTFIKEKGTGQEIPDAPRYINFCRGDVADTQSEASEDDNYSVAQFPRSINPAFRSSSPQPSTYESHHDPNSVLAQDLGHREPAVLATRENSMAPRGTYTGAQRQSPPEALQQALQPHPQQRLPSELSQHGSIAAIPHDPYPLDGMTMLCRTGPPSERSSHLASARPSSRDSHSDYSNPTSMSSMEPPSGKSSPTKQEPALDGIPDKRVLKKRSGFFQNHSPFRRKSTKESPGAVSNRNTWHSAAGPNAQASPVRRPQLFSKGGPAALADRAAGSPEPIDANASLALNVGQNVFNVSTPDMDKRAGSTAQPASDETDPIALALAELKGLGNDKQASARVSADRYHGIATPGPNTHQQFSKSVPPISGNSAAAAGLRGTPPPSYDQQVQRLGVPQPAVTARAMKETSQKFADQTRSMFGSGSRPASGSGSYGGRSQSRPPTRGAEVPRAASPAAPRSTSPRPSAGDGMRAQHRSASPNPMASASRGAAASGRSSDQGYYHNNSPREMARSASPAPYRTYAGSSTGHALNDMAVQLAPGSDDTPGSQRGRGGGRPGTSSSNRAIGLYDGGGPVHNGSRQRSKSVADPSRQYTSDGRPILHFARALYVYQAAIPEELGFAKGDILAVLRHQDDGWWEAEVHGGNGRIGLVPSNYLQPC